jgi:hypothetical protein
MGLFSFGQSMSGIYTVGGSSPDFVTLKIAFDSLHTNGMSGPVVLNIRPGIYPDSLKYDSIPGNTELNLILVQSEMQDSSTVKLQTQFYNEIKLESVNIHFAYLSFESLSNYSAIRIFGKSVAFKSCYFTHFGNLNAVNLLNASADKLVIDSCVFFGGEYAIIEGSSDSLFLTNSKISGTRRGFSLQPQYCLMKGNTIDSTLSSGYMIIRFEKLDLDENYFTPSRGYLDLYGGDLIMSLNHFFIEINRIDVDSFLCEKNYFDKEVDGFGGINYLNMNNNYLFDDLDLTFVSGIVDSNVFVRASLKVDSFAVISNNNASFSLGSTAVDTLATILMKNNIAKNLGLQGFAFANVEKNRCVYGDFYKIKTIIVNANVISKFNIRQSSGSLTNNCFNSSFNSSLCPQLKVFHNNFRMKYTWISANSVQAFNNNFSGRVSWSGSSSHDYNNYYPLSIFSEPHGISVDPLYIDTIFLRAQNSMLSHKGQNLGGFVQTDFDGVFRADPPSIGAHEICVPLTNFSKTIEVMCGSTISLDVCQDGNSYEYYWSPSTGLSDSTIANPVITAYSSIDYRVNIFQNGNFIATDSIKVHVIPFHVDASPDTTQRTCGNITQLYASWSQDATYQWSPALGLDDSLSRTPNATPEITTEYFVTTTIPGCGNSVDSVTLFVKPLPIAIFNWGSFGSNYIKLYSIS